jgi:hypothetical protein
VARARRGIAVAVAIGGAIACAAGAWAALSTQTGCQLQGSCDPSSVFVPSLPKGATLGQNTTVQGYQGGAGVIDGTWRSSAFEGTWMNFPGQISYYVYPQLPDGGPFVGPYLPGTCMVSADPNPESPDGGAAGSNAAYCAGNLAELMALPDGGQTGFIVTNDTCSPYFLWLEVAQEYPDAGANGATD